MNRKELALLVGLSATTGFASGYVASEANKYLASESLIAQVASLENRVDKGLEDLVQRNMLTNERIIGTQRWVIVFDKRMKTLEERRTP